MTHYALYSLQAALLLKSQVQAIRQDDLMELSTDTDIADLIGEAINLDRYSLPYSMFNFMLAVWKNVGHFQSTSAHDPFQ